MMRYFGKRSRKSFYVIALLDRPFTQVSTPKLLKLKSSTKYASYFAKTLRSTSKRITLAKKQLKERIWEH